MDLLTAAAVASSSIKFLQYKKPPNNERLRDMYIVTPYIEQGRISGVSSAFAANALRSLLKIFTDFVTKEDKTILMI
ncbi:hypothetical protein [Paenibacillus sp. PK3_47]|uniref:hypothetical protein n=1 Tax=Paenibacillus sp. PK3_47 TaxID=2072642 RepID=UPI00201E3DBE|nr:hypothetical protein [Paenibacillus sp. PK3_47]